MLSRIHSITQPVLPHLSPLAEPPPAKSRGLTALVTVVGLALVGFTVAPAIEDALVASRTRGCTERLEKIARATSRWVEAKGAYPYVTDDPSGAAALELLVREGFLDGAEDLVCPHRPHEAIGYAGFACPYRAGDVPDTSIILWDSAAHEDGARMVVSVFEPRAEQVDAAAFAALEREGMADAKTGAGGLSCALRLRDLARAIDAGSFDPQREACDYEGYLASEPGTLGPGPVVWERQADRNGYRFVAIKPADGEIEVESHRMQPPFAGDQPLEHRP